LRIKPIISFLLITLACPLIILAQEDKDDHSGHHHHTRNEVGGAVGVVYSLTEQHTASGFHLHYMRMFGGKLHNFGLAPGLEFILGEDSHYAIHVLAVYRPTHGWWLGLGPGIAYFGHDNELGFSGHVETGYEFDAGKIHFGPVLEYAWSNHDQHILIGLHLGVPF